MEEKKVVMPPPPKELKNMPPPPPPRPLPPKPMNVEEEVNTVEELQDVKTFSIKENDVEESKTELLERKIEDVESPQKIKKSSGGIKTMLYWGGFVLSLVAIGIIVYLLVK